MLTGPDRPGSQGSPHGFKLVETPVGLLKLVGTDKQLVAILWENDEPRRVRLRPLVERPHSPILVEAERQLAGYFAGTLKTFTIPLWPEGTRFQKSVWTALLTIPFGQTRTYAEIARQIGAPAACRAVGAANGRNPISIIAPCHRVIGSTGELTGFAGGLPAKRWLLAFEAQSVGRGLA